MIMLTEGQLQLRHNHTHLRNVNWPISISSDIEGAFNHVLHTPLVEILRHYGFLSSMVDTIAKFNLNRMIYQEFDREKEPTLPFEAGLA